MNVYDVIAIRNMAADDLALVFEWRNDPLIRKHMFNAEPIEPDGHAAWFDKTRQDPTRHPLLVCKGGKPFGFVQYNVSACGKVADWGFYVDPGDPKGKGAILGRAALDYGFNTLGLNRICGHVLAENPRSLLFHTSLGFTAEGVLRFHHSTANGYQDVHLFGLLAEEWR